MRKAGALLGLAAMLTIGVIGCGKAGEAPDEHSRDSDTLYTDVVNGGGEEESGGAALKDGTDSAAAGEEALQELFAAGNEQSLPMDLITLPFQSEIPFDDADYPDLAERGRVAEEEVQQIEESIEDLLEMIDAQEAFGENFRNGVFQSYLRDEQGSLQICRAEICDGAPEMDAIMAKAGYKQYYVTYCYPVGLWRQAQEAITPPLMAELAIGGHSYRYIFADRQLACRYEDSDIRSVNPQVNDFINSIYKMGCYYGTVLAADRGQYALYITSLDQLTPAQNGYVLTAAAQEAPGDCLYFFDEETVFAESCALDFFEGYQEGDTPLTWITRVYENQEEYPMALIGVLDVLAEDHHIVEIRRSLYWD